METLKLKYCGNDKYMVIIEDETIILGKGDLQALKNGKILYANINGHGRFIMWNF